MKKEIDIECGFYTLKEAAKLLRLHEMTLYRWVRKNRMPVVSLGGRWRFPKKLLNEWIENCGNQKEGV